MGTHGIPDAETLARRLSRQRRARAEAEAIAERATSDLYEAVGELERVNEELAAMNKALIEFVAVASHDLRGPLASILGYSQTMLEDWDAISDAEKLEFISVIVRNGRQLTRLLDDLLVVSRIEAGALDTQAEVVRLGEAFDQAITTFAEHASEIRISCPDAAAVMADPDHLQRILVNYVTNALKYGKPPVEVEASTDDDYVEIRVRDLGQGVPEDFVGRLFGKFARADTEITRKQEGTGLGLSIVKGLAQANGGEAWYEPNEPAGSCFAVRLPKATAA